MNKIVLVAGIVLACLGLALCFVINKTNDDKKQTLNSDSNNLQITQFNVDGRVTLKKDDAIYVGNNLKELENNFYDIKIVNTKDGIVIYLNKLWYETYGLDYIQNEYLARICRELSDRLNVENSSEQFEYLLYKYIKDNYVKVRQNEQVERITTDKLSLKLELEDSVVKLIIN